MTAVVMPYSTHGLKPPSADGELRNRFELATPYGPNLNSKGLDVSLAPEVLHQLRAGWEEMRLTAPDFYVGLTVFGSLVKGRVHMRSDVDAVIYYNVGAGFGMRRRPNPRYEADADKFIRPKLRTISDSFGNTEDILFEPMSEAIIDEELRFLEFQKNHSDDHLRRCIDDGLLCLFNLRVGTGMVQVFRKRIIEGLSQFEDGDRVWGLMMESLARYEEGSFAQTRRNASISLPQTLQDARVYFRLSDSDVPSGSRYELKRHGPTGKTAISQCLSL